MINRNMITRTNVARWTAQTFIVASMTLAPAAIAIGLATSAQAAPPINSNDPGTSSTAPHHTFPSQHNFPAPGSRIHHHHQHNH